jgi:hypothetical protein
MPRGAEMAVEAHGKAKEFQREASAVILELESKMVW